MLRPVLLASVLFTVLAASPAFCQDGEMKALQKQNDELKRQLEQLTKENESLKKDLEAMKAKAAPAKQAQPTDPFTQGNELSGTWRNNDKSNDGKVTLTIKERDKAKFKGIYVLSFSDPKLTDQTYEVKGEVNNSTVTIETVGSAKKIKMNLTIKSDEVTGTYENSIGTKGKVAFPIQK
jgi:hypothetical protein